MNVGTHRHWHSDEDGFGWLMLGLIAAVIVGILIAVVLMGQLKIFAIAFAAAAVLSSAVRPPGG